MCGRGLFKRLVPFFLTFATGLFIASFFVNIAGPGFGFGNRRMEKFRQMQELRIENQQLREDNCRMRRQLEARHRDSLKDGDSDFDAVPPLDLDNPPPPVPAPDLAPPPPAPKRVR